MPVSEGRTSHRSAKEAAAVSAKEQKKKKKKSKKERQLPRKCAVIRRSLASDGTEKTEFRFVAYRRTDGTSTQANIFDDVGQFLEEQLKKKIKEDNTETEKTTTLCETTTTPATGAVSVLSTLSSDAIASTHHEGNCMKSDYLRKVIPTLEALSAYWEKKYKKSGRQQDKQKGKIVQEVLADTQKALLSGGIPIGSISERIRSLIEICDDKKKK